jgi:hypothetical protein
VKAPQPVDAVVADQCVVVPGAVEILDVDERVALRVAT